MDSLIQTLPVLTAMLAPAVMISACSLILLGFSNKHSQAIASLRRLNSELRQHREIPDGASETTYRQRDEQLLRQCTLMRRRVHLVLTQIQALTSAITLFLATSLTIGGALLLHWNAIVPILSLMIAGILALAVAMLQVFPEVRLIRTILDTEIPAPEGPHPARTHLHVSLKG
jgi:hypothetical protein